MTILMVNGVMRKNLLEKETNGNEEDGAMKRNREKERTKK